MISINDYKDLKIGDQFYFIDDKCTSIHVITSIDGSEGSYLKIAFNPYVETNGFIYQFYTGSPFSNKCFMYFREKNIEKLLNDEV